MIVPAVDTPEPPGSLAPELLQEVAGTFGMLSATARLQIVWLLADGERDVGTLAAEVGQSVATVSQHLAKLKLAGLVRARREGRRQVYLVENPQVVDLVRLAVGHHHERHGGRGRGAAETRGA
jgi:DNA-binding transcriptional ArsR family regulator